MARLTFEELTAMDLTGWQCVVNGWVPTMRAVIEKVIAHDDPKRLEFVFTDKPDRNVYPENVWVEKDIDCKSLFVPDREGMHIYLYPRGHITLYVVDIGDVRLLPKGRPPYEFVIGKVLEKA